MGLETHHKVTLHAPWHYYDVVLQAYLPVHVTASKSGGFTYHEKTPAITTSLINPAQNTSRLSFESAMATSTETCPTFLVRSFT